MTKEPFSPTAKAQPLQEENRENRDRFLAEHSFDRPRISKIVFIITRADDLGGAQAHVLELASALAGRGYRVTVLAGAGGVLFEALAARGVRYGKLQQMVRPIRLFKDWAALKEIRAVLQELKPDLVTTHSNKAGFLGRLAARSLNIPVIHTSHGFLFSERKGSAAGRFYRLMEKHAARAAHRVIAVSESEFVSARTLEVIPAGKLALVHNGLPDVQKEFLAQPDLEPPGLVMVARFARPKDHRTLMEALSGLKDRQWSLQMVGEGPEMEPMRRFAGRLGLSERVSFLGRREDVSAILAAAQIFVLSSRREGFPLSILEAMRAGLPVVAARVGGTAEAVQEGESGFLFPPGDSRALKKRLLELIDDPCLRRDLGRAGRKRYQEHFTLEQMVEKTLQVYESVI